MFREPDGEGANGPDASDDFIITGRGDRPIAVQRLSRSGKARRLLIPVALVAVTAAILLGGQTVSALFPKTVPHLVSVQSDLASFPAYTPPTPYKVHLPPGSSTSPISMIHLSPASGRPAEANTAYVCWVSRGQPELARARSLQVAVTVDGGATWTPLTPPAQTGGSCSIQVDSLGATAALLAIFPEATAQAPCPLPALFHSANAGLSWRVIPLPPDAQPVCGVQFTLAHGVIYLSADKPLSHNVLSSSSVRSVSGLLLRSTDFGVSWRACDTMGVATSARVIAVRDSGVTLAEASIATGGGQVYDALFESHDYGDAWAEVARLPASQTTVHASANPDERSEGGWGPLYATVTVHPQGKPAGVAILQVWKLSSDHTRWERLPAIPSVLSPDAPAPDEDTVVVGVGSSGSLIVAAPAPDVPNQETPSAKYLWLWDATQQQWALDSYRIDSGAYFSDLGWYHNSPTLWITYIHLGIPPHIELFTAPLPNASASTGA